MTRRLILILGFLCAVTPAVIDARAQTALPGQSPTHNLTQKPLISGTINGVRWALFAPGHDDTRDRGQGTLTLTAPPDGQGVRGSYDRARQAGTLRYRSRGTLNQLLDMHDEQLKRQGFTPGRRTVSGTTGSITYTRAKGRLTLRVSRASDLFEATLELRDVTSVARQPSLETPQSDQQRSP